MKLTAKGRFVVAVAKVAALVVAGVIFGHVVVEGFAADAKVRDAQVAPYVEAANAKKLRQSMNQ